MRSATRLDRIAAVALLVAVAAVGGCGTTTESPVPPARCIDLGEEVVQLAWSQTGTFLGVGTVDAEGNPWVRSLRIDDPDLGDGGEAMFQAGMLSETVVVGSAGELAWIAESEIGRFLVEDAPTARSARLPDGVSAIGWTAIGYALLQHQAEGGSRILNLDVDRPDEPIVSYATDLHAERFWISADPESMVLTIAHPDHRDVPASFQVVLSDVEQHLEPVGADASGASMPALRRWVVYRSTTTSRMEAVRVAEPGTSVVLSDRAANRGMVSDRGVLAFVPVEPQGQLCLVDVAARLP